MKLFLMQLNKI